MSVVKVPYTRMYNYHLSYRDVSTGPGAQEKTVDTVASDAFCSLSIGRSFSLERALRNAARQCDVHVWIRSDGHQLSIGEGWNVVTQAEWNVFDFAAMELFQSVWYRKIEAARRVRF